MFRYKCKTFYILNFCQKCRDLCVFWGKIENFGNLTGVKYLTNSMSGCKRRKWGVFSFVWVSLSGICDTRRNLHFLINHIKAYKPYNIYRGIWALTHDLFQIFFHSVPNCTAQYWPTTCKYQPALSYTDPSPPSINWYCPIMTQ